MNISRSGVWSAVLSAACCVPGSAFAQQPQQFGAPANHHLLPERLPAVEQTPAAPSAPSLPAPKLFTPSNPQSQPLEELPPGDDVLGRLREAEARINALEAEKEAEEDDGPPGTLLGLIADRWETAEDPEIAIATYQMADKKDGKKKKGWYEKIGIRGYTQFRLNEVLDEDPFGAPAQHTGDRSIGEHQNFLIRRARLIIFGDVSDHMYVYLQPDFASSVPGSPDANHFTQIRDWYADCYCDTDKVHRFRVGQSKVPYGWENMQSSSNRLPLDRNDGLNSAVRNERDLGVFYYWTPEYAQEFFADVLDQGLKGSGNYGVFGFGVYNGQGGSFVEQNDNVHVVARLTVPFQLDNCQYVELGMQGYTGMYTVLSSPIFPNGVGPSARPLGTLETNGRAGIRDERVAWSAIWYPQPWGFQCEWNVGRGPALNDAQTAVEERALYGGYLQTMYRYESACHGIFFPYYRWSLFNGGYKPERNAPFSHVDEHEVGCEWQINPQMELTTAFTFTDRTNTTALNALGDVSYQQFQGSLLRFQFQFNY